MNEFFVIVSSGQSQTKYWGRGPTIAKAKKEHAQAGGKNDGELIIFRFISEFPFAPMNREATKTEADVWIDENGTVHIVHCELDK